MTTWPIIFSTDEPVRGEISDVDAAIGEFEGRHTAAQAIVDRFDSVRSSGVDGHLEGPVGETFAMVVDEMHAGLGDLPRVARSVVDVLSEHRTRLRELRDAADEALARATTAWNALNDAQDELGPSAARVRSLTDQLRGAADDADTSSTEASLGVAERSLESVNREIDTQQAILDSIFMWGGSGEYQELAHREHELADTLDDELQGIDLGELGDPGFWEKVGSAIAGFAVGIVESVVNLVEAYLTGDWATFFHELRNLLNAALLILGTIALFTGVGAPLFFLAVAAFAVTAGLWITQTPNPQTGETVSGTDVLISAAGVAFGAGGAVRNYSKHGMRLFTTRVAPSGSTAGAGSGFGAVRTTLDRSVHVVRTHVSSGGLASTVRDVRNVRTLWQGGQGSLQAAEDLNAVWYRFPATAPISRNWTTARVAWGTRSKIGMVQTWTDQPLGPIGTVTGSDGLNSVRGRAGEPSGFNLAQPLEMHTQGTPVFSTPANPVTIERVAEQMRSEPNVTVVNAP